MAEVGKIKNVKSLLRKLEKLERVANRQNTGNVVVGYNASYALYVHENVEMKWKGIPRDPRIRQVSSRSTKKMRGKRKRKPRGLYWDPQGRGQAKFLEQPARELRPQMRKIIAEAVAKGAPLIKALLMAGLFLQRESQKLVPIDTGNLRGSAFTEVE